MAPKYDGYSKVDIIRKNGDCKKILLRQFESVKIRVPPPPPPRRAAPKKECPPICPKLETGTKYIITGAVDKYGTSLIQKLQKATNKCNCDDVKLTVKDASIRYRTNEGEKNKKYTFAVKEGCGCK